MLLEFRNLLLALGSVLLGPRNLLLALGNLLLEPGNPSWRLGFCSQLRALQRLQRSCNGPASLLLHVQRSCSLGNSSWTLGNLLLQALLERS